MLQAVADTHAIIWYLYGDARLSDAARFTIEEAARTGDRVGISTITLAEILYLGEKGRMHPETFERLISALDQPGAVLLELPFDRNVAGAMRNVERNRVPALPDRIIAATAQLYEVPVISRDRQITLSGLPVVW